MPSILCEHCTGVCCRYIALPIDTPETAADFDDIRWYLLHEDVSVFVEDGDWYISFATNCRHLLPDNRCAIYPTRPRICRQYTTDTCDYHSGDYGWEHHFTAPEHLEAYRAAHPPARRRRTGPRGPATARQRAPDSARPRSNGRRRLTLRPQPPRGAERAPAAAGAPPTDGAALATTDRHGTPLPVLPPGCT